jgi:hypothetical protein
MDPLTLVLRILHIVGGTLWVGSGLYIQFILVPALRRVPEPVAARAYLRVFAQTDRLIGPAAGATFFAGIALVFDVRWGTLGTFFATGWGWAILISFLLVVASSVIAARVFTPASKRFAAIYAETGDGELTESQSADVRTIADRIARAGQIDIVILLIVVALMASARYL